MEKKVFEIGQVMAMKEMLDTMHVADIAEELENMDEAISVKVFRMLPKDKAAEVFAYLSRDTRQQIVESITDREISGIMDELFLDDAVDFIEEMPANVVKRVLANVPVAKRNMINHFLKYPDDSAGSIMTIEYVELKKHDTVSDAFAHIRKTGIDKETIYTCYVIDSERILLGAVSVKSLLLAEPEDLIGDIMRRNVISVKTSENKQNAVSDIVKYDLLSMPVVDNEGRLVGIVTVDDALDVQEEEATEDFELMAAISPSDEPYLKTSVLTLTKKRVLWLLLLMLSATVTGTIISSFEEALAALPSLVAFIPMLMNTGGNAGSQSSTLVIRGMALDEISLKNAGIVLWKELRVALLCGFALVVVNFLRIMLMSGDWMMALTVSSSLYCTVVVAKSFGCLLPMAAKKLGLDPAVMSSPVITTVVDAVTLLVYFALSRSILGI